MTSGLLAILLRERGRQIWARANRLGAEYARQVVTVFRDGFHGYGFVDGPLLRRFPKGKKNPLRCDTGGANSCEYDQAPLGELETTDTTEAATAEARSKR